ncbi:MAG: NUDIX hydrolase [Gemmatimonadota bacterium]
MSGPAPIRQVFAAYDRPPLADGIYQVCPCCGGDLAVDAAHSPPRQRCADCRWIHYRNPSPGVTVLIADGDRVLVGRRGPESFAPGQWCLPGGFIEFEEDFLTAAVREVREETGLEVAVREIINVATNFLAPELHTLVVVLRAEIVGGAATPGDDLAELRWVRRGDPLPEMAFEADRHVVERWAAGDLHGMAADPGAAAVSTPGGARELEMRSLAEAPGLRASAEALIKASFPAFLLQDKIGCAEWPGMCETFPECQLALVEAHTGAVAAAGFCLPLAWQGPAGALPDEGWDWALGRGLEDARQGRPPQVLCAVAIGVAPAHRGGRLSARLLEAMRDIGRQRGLEDLIAPVRPTLKQAYPLVTMAAYVQWRTAEGLPFDPWMRVHARLGATIEKVCARSMAVSGTVAQWEAWTGMRFPGTGPHVVPGALAPVSIDRQADRGVYVEENVWMRHPLR